MLSVISNSFRIIECLDKNFITNHIIDLNRIKVDDKFYKSYLVIEPLNVKSIHVNISTVWKRYLTTHSPESKLVVMGFSKFNSRNYIDLLNLPSCFPTYMKNALPVSEKLDICFDGGNIQEYLKSFFSGHGSNSVLSRLSQLMQSLNIAQTQIVSKESSFRRIWNELLLPYAKPEWVELIKQWNNYYPFFEYLPFYPEIQEIDRKISTISELFSCPQSSETLFSKLDISSYLNIIHDQLLKINKKYFTIKYVDKRDNTLSK